MSIETFKADLAILSADQMVQRWVLTGSCAAIDDTVAHAIRDAIAANFVVEYNDVVVVGSARLGFSIKPSRRFGAFGEESDVDVAVVSTNLFERVWKEVFSYERSGAYWPDKSSFRKYLSRGWIRPDFLPPAETFDFASRWWPFFNALSISGCPYKITCGIYHSQFFLREYQKICIEQCRDQL